jgi:hypothetical protein
MGRAPPRGLVVFWLVGERGFCLTAVPARLPGVRFVRLDRRKA